MEKNGKKGTFFIKERKRTERRERSFEKNGCPTLVLTLIRVACQPLPKEGLVRGFSPTTVVTSPPKLFWSSYQIQKEWSYNLRPIPDFKKIFSLRHHGVTSFWTKVGVFSPMPLLLGLRRLHNTVHPPGLLHIHSSMVHTQTMYFWTSHQWGLHDWQMQWQCLYRRLNR